MSESVANGASNEPMPIEKPKRKRATKAKGKAKSTKGTRAPRTADPAKLDAYGFRVGSIRSRAAAMYKKGATLADVKAETGGIQYNVLNELKAAGFEIKETTVKGIGKKTSTRYKIIGKTK